MPEFLAAPGGAEWTPEESQRAGQRIAMTPQRFDLKTGVNFLEHKSPKRVLGPLASGPAKGVKAVLYLMMKEFMEGMGRDAQTTMPRSEILSDLNLDRFN